MKAAKRRADMIADTPSSLVETITCSGEVLSTGIASRFPSMAASFQNFLLLGLNVDDGRVRTGASKGENELRVAHR